MGWFNYYGLIAVALILLPNILCAILDKTIFASASNNKALNALEQAGRFGCVAFMIFNIPYTYFGFWFDKALIVYLSAGGALVLFYILGWLIFCKKRSLAKALWLSITPTMLFTFCGIMLSSIPLLVFAVLFGASHITLSVMNEKQRKNLS